MSEINKNKIDNKVYFEDLKQIKETIRTNQYKAMVSVNTKMIETYYVIGTIINERKTWGSKYIEKLSKDLNEFGKGFSCEQLKRMARFASEFTINEIRSQPATQIPWYTLNEIMYKSKTHDEMLFYIKETHKNGWSRSMVLNQIAMKAYERSLIEPITTEVVKENPEMYEMFKDTLAFEFIDKDKVKNEKDLKNQMIANIIKFLKELGEGFALVDKEYRFTLGGDDFYIDLLMYNIKIHSYVVIEVKIGKFDPRDMGQLIFYVNAVDQLLKSDIDNNTIGLLLTKDSNSETCKACLKNINLPLLILLFISQI